MSAPAALSVRSIDNADDIERPGAIYRALGVEPIVNCAGVRTNYGGSNPSPEVLAAMASAAQAFVDLDELAEAVGRRLGELTGAPWGVVTSGTAAALALATAACIAGNDPELMVRLPRMQGIANRVIMPAGQRFAYDSAIRMTGAEIVEVASAEEFAAALDDSVAMICILARSDARSALPLRLIAPAARQHGIPALVDAAGLKPCERDPWLAQGADLVIYSGGKYLRGPQSTGLLLGAKHLCQAAWINGAPHQAFGRPMKVGKEEIVGAVVALEHWIKHRDPQRDEEAWRRRLAIFADRLRELPGVTTGVLPSGSSVSVPRLRISWNTGMSAEVLRVRLLGQTPPIVIHDFWSTASSIVVDPFNLSDTDAGVAADAIAAALAAPGSAAPPLALDVRHDVSGRWDVSIAFLHGRARHRLELVQSGRRLEGRHVARASRGVVSGSISGCVVTFQARHEASPMPLYYGFTGTVADGCLRGELTVGACADEHNGPVFRGQFGAATWQATATAPAARDAHSRHAGDRSAAFAEGDS